MKPPIGQRLRHALAGSVDRLPLPGTGSTVVRFTTLAAIGATDLSVGRLAEAHADAVAICAEAGRLDLATGLLGVWASDGPSSRVEAAHGPGRWRLSGTKYFCSGTTVVDRALITAHAPDGLRLFAVDLQLPGIAVDTQQWAACAFAETATGTVRFDVELGDQAAVGGPGFYLARPGFWHGAIGVAACWAGGARSLVDRYRQSYARIDTHALAHLGAVEAQCWAMAAILHKAADEIDADPLDSSRAALSRALAVRHMIESGCEDVLTRLGRAAGPRPAVFDPWFAQQSADLAVYLRQCHGERDLEALGHASLVPPSHRDERPLTPVATARY